MDVTGSCWIVYASTSRICEALKIFIGAYFTRLNVRVYSLSGLKVWPSQPIWGTLFEVQGLSVKHKRSVGFLFTINTETMRRGWSGLLELFCFSALRVPQKPKSKKRLRTTGAADGLLCFTPGICGRRPHLSCFDARDEKAKLIFPCKIDWNSMQDHEKGKFCEACQKKRCRITRKQIWTR